MDQLALAVVAALNLVASSEAGLLIALPFKLDSNSYCFDAS